jgi:hypothetical protein
VRSLFFSNINDNNIQNTCIEQRSHERMVTPEASCYEAYIVLDRRFRQRNGSVSVLSRSAEARRRRGTRAAATEFLCADWLERMTPTSLWKPIVSSSPPASDVSNK